MKAVILAGGPGSRLGQITNNIHKSLLKVGETPILDWQIKNLHRRNITEIIVVTGYRAKEVKNRVSKLDQELTSSRIHTVHNENWDTTENLHSLSLTEPQLRGDSFIIMNCDIYPSSQIFDIVADDDRTPVAPFDSEDPEEDALQIKLNSNGQPDTILEKGHSEGDGATLGLFSLNESASEALFQDIDNSLWREDVRAFWFEHSLGRILPEYNFEPVDVRDYLWFEVDTRADLIKAWRELGWDETDVEVYIKGILNGE